jgi:N-acetylglutamate synthase-like GNAT family acetyltransferase
MDDDYAARIACGQVWVAEAEGVLVGVLVLVVAADHLLLDNIAVSPAAQGTGLGTRLLEFTEAQARAHDKSEVRLYTNEKMTENIAYYGRHGFRETRRATELGLRRVYFARSLSE